ncbi:MULTISPECIES: hypothetical protein [Klebsiella]|uniref:hypothetical protein n=1 Tax=Klebsiella TaxID=570 RepID=UPI000EFD8278|nr:MULTISPECIES: hypothetical protein [Klebsiella]MBG8568629.1 hypothetical protein [Klebsiella michiganensis]MDV1071736.1 hypothetical protein [Klebsiella pasteurii]MDV1077580.1 hypothetical protein [Klebsiella pasteurii]RMC92998.1 hypothetical protein EBH72_10770 [Klebsiella michiganensis]HDX8828664.1 hypothetical protein [Klebsiella michiganensis]
MNKFFWVILAALLAQTTGIAIACDIGAARMAIQSAQSNADDAASADDLDDAQSCADDASSDASSAEIYLSDCN